MHAALALGHFGVKVHRSEDRGRTWAEVAAPSFDAGHAAPDLVRDVVGDGDLEEVAGDVAARAWQLTHQERIKICFPEAFPMVRFDYGLFLQALNNLVENSLRYEPADSQIEICGSVETNEVRVIVANHGPNIPPEEREAIIEHMQESVCQTFAKYLNWLANGKTPTSVIN